VLHALFHALSGALSLVSLFPVLFFGVNIADNWFTLVPAKRFTTDHELIKFDDESGIGTVSITDYAQKSLGDVVFVELPEAGESIKQGGEPFLFWGVFFFQSRPETSTTLQSLLAPSRALKRPRILFVRAEDALIFRVLLSL
jgi:Glycine cleavage H-protein